MKKKLFLVIGAFIIVVGLFIGLLVWNAGSLIDRFSPLIEKRIGELLQTDVRLGEIGFSVYPETKLTIEKFELREKNGGKQGVGLGGLSLAVELMPLLQKELIITKLTLQSPHISLVRDQHGISVVGLERQPSSQDTSKMPNESDGKPKDGRSLESQQTSSSAFSMELRQFQIEDAEISVTDKILKKDFAVNGINVESEIAINSEKIALENLSLSGKLLGEYELDIALPTLTYSLTPSEIELPKFTLNTLTSVIEGAFSLDLESGKGSAKLHSTDIRIAPVLEVARDFFPTIPELTVTGSVIPDLTLQLPRKGEYALEGPIALQNISVKVAGRSITGGKGKLLLNANPRLQKVELSSVDLELDSTPMNTQGVIEKRDTEVLLKDLQVNMFSGSVRANTMLKLEQQKTFLTTFLLQGMQIESLLHSFAPSVPVEITGELSDFHGKVGGTLGDDLLRSLEGSLSFVVKNGTLKEVNLAREVLDAITGIPSVSGALTDAIPESKRAVLASADTKVDQLSGSCSVSKGTIKTDDLRLENNTLLLSGSGTAGFDGTLDMQATLAFQPEFTEVLVQSVKELQYGVDQEKRLVIPTRIQRTSKGLRVLPDVGAILENSMKGALRDKAGSILDKALGPQNDGKTDPKKEMIREGLKGVFGF